MFKDRKDGKYVKAEDAIHAVMPYIFDKRCDAEVYINEELDITKLKNWVDEKNKSLDFKMTYFQALVGIFAKVYYNRPMLNRFVQGHRMYQRNEFSVSFVAKNKMADNAEDMMVVVYAKPEDNLEAFCRVMAVDIFKTKSAGTNSLDGFLNKITKMPRWLLKIVARGFKWLDYHGWLPNDFTRTDSNYASLLVSNLGSIKCNSCYHHLNNYGTNSVMITIGIIKEVEGRFVVDLGCTLDERIASGFYFAKSMKLAQYILDNPELFEDRLDKLIEWE